MIQYVMHFGICVRDLERSIRFYREGLGFEEAGGIEISGEPIASVVEIPDVELRAVYLDRDGVRIELLHFPVHGTVGSDRPRPMNQPGLTHFTVRVDDLDEAVAKLTALGAKVLEHTRVHDPTFGADIVYVTDPDGTRLELIRTDQDPTR